MLLHFDDDLGKRHFEFCFVGFVLGGSLLDKKGLPILRREVGLFAKLEAISDPKPCGKKMVNGEPERQLKVADSASCSGVPLVLDVEPAEFDLLYNYVAGVPWQSGTPVKYAVETLDWLQQESQHGGA